MTPYHRFPHRFPHGFPALLRLAGLAVALSISACAGSAARPQSIEQRAQSRWDALLAKDFEQAYAYLSPGFRSSQSLSDYEMAFRLRRVHYDSAEYMDQQCEADACTVRLNMGYTLIAPLRGVKIWKSKAVIEEKWVRIDGHWWFLPGS